MLLRTGEAAVRLGLSVDRIRGLVREGRLEVAQFTPLGMLFAEARVDELVEARKHGRVLRFADAQPVAA